jgi:hypothetical protein
MFTGHKLVTARLHSSRSVQSTPLPVYPAVHAHENELAVSVHNAIPAAQLCVLSAHSFAAVHTVTPLPT